MKTVKLRHDLFQASAIITALRLAVALLAATATFALAGCGGGGSPNLTAPPPQTKQETPHKVDIPSGHKLADWLKNTNNPDGTITIPAGESLDAGGVRFTCSSQRGRLLGKGDACRRLHHRNLGRWYGHGHPRAAPSRTDRIAD